MSVYERSIKAFIQVIETKPSLFYPEDRISLHELVSDSGFPKDVEEIYEEIEKWIKAEKRNQIREAFKTEREKLDSSFSFSGQDLGLGGAKSSTGTRETSPAVRELLIDSTKKLSSSDGTKSNQKP
ncbi:hypothetical protein A6S26_23075 [Nostoc sp. ATCC 43529]|nr:hypothetical protein A6S26_23075 [Nostoc sp. ATCC 43529]